jgi:lipopolysaccharide/colanic/teichoic acid biosynthesis glycosyltransferase
MIPLVRFQFSSISEVFSLLRNLCTESAGLLSLISCVPMLPRMLYSSIWELKCFIDRFAATLILVLSSPINLVIALLIRSTAPGPISPRQWSIRQREKRQLKLLHFERYQKVERSSIIQSLELQQNSQKTLDSSLMTQLVYWIHKCCLDLPPFLVNILKSEMNIVELKP